MSDLKENQPQPKVLDGGIEIKEIRDLEAEKAFITIQQKKFRDDSQETLEFVISLKGKQTGPDPIRSIELNFVEDSQVRPRPSFDRKSDTATVYFPMSQFNSVVNILRDTKRVGAWYWTDNTDDMYLAGIGMKLKTY